MQFISALISLALSSVTSVSPEKIAPGYTLEVGPLVAARGLAPSTRTFRDRIDLRSSGDFGGHVAPFEARIDAILSCPVDGDYEFRLDADESARIIVDEEVLSSLSGADIPRVVTKRLSAGPHRLLIEKSETDGDARLKVEWRNAGDADFRILDASVLSAMWVPARVVVFSKTAGFRHDSIPEGIEMFRSIGDRRGLEIIATEDSAALIEALPRADAVIFLNTTGDVLNGEQELAFERFIRRGGGFVGVHSAADTEYDWPFYADLVGAYFKSHPAIQEAAVLVREPRHLTTTHLPSVWRRRDEWYDFRAAPKPHVNRILDLDETTYQNGSMNGDHPIAWWHEYHGSRALYCAMGHTKESYKEPNFIEFLERAILWSCRRIDSSPKRE